MITFRHVTTIALAVSAVLVAAPAMAGSNHGGVGGAPNQYDYPPSTEPGQCYSRRVTGAGGAYRWDRIECDGLYSQGAYGGGQWGHGGQLEVETRPSYGYQQSGYTADCGCAGYRYENPCDPCASYGGGYANGGGYTSDRYGERRYSQSQYAYERGSYDSGYAYGRGDQGYPPPYGYGASSYDYSAAGRDEAGYLIWPGKTP